MADDTPIQAPKRRAATGTAAQRRTSNPEPKANPMNATTSTDAKDTLGTTTGAAAGATAHRDEAKSRFNAAIGEAKAGAAALKAEATERAGVYREQASARGKDWATEARAYGEDAKVKGRDLATQGKGKLTEGLTAIGQAVADSASVVDEKLGAKYGDYARSASRSINDAATRLDSKTIDDLAEDGRAFVRKSPGTAVGIAAVVGFMLSRLFRR